ncbi:FMN-binding protein [Miniphocaeibacter halophilus]|uniref:FMN-binding protein n=1 Tax=Miniphocaeibacter halophilus TaxID=2931922 RepID=A0AC61MSR4_9FIRM|nr:FMN-binding protein [Miniphocaeibacter halophilus]QQK08647.1 FMN-binding protein [Miniphocaeibacter halophilus]
MAKKKSMIFPVVFMVLLAGILTFLLAVINEVSLPVIEFNQKIELQEKILSVFNILPEEATPQEIDSIFNENIKEEDYEGKKLYIQEENGENVAYAVPFDGPGLWGSIDGYLGIKSDLKTVTGIEFIKQEETPGLGGRISEPEYKEQFRNLDISDSSSGEIVINKPAPGGNIDAITGATQTSTFVTNMINEDIMNFINTRKEV